MQVKVLVNGEDRISPWASYVVQEEGVAFCQKFWHPSNPYQLVQPRPPSPASPRVYECHIGISSAREAVNTYTDFTEQVLPRIVSLGYNTVQLMSLSF